MRFIWADRRPLQPEVGLIDMEEVWRSPFDFGLGETSQEHESRRLATVAPRLAYVHPGSGVGVAFDAAVLTPGFVARRREARRGGAGRAEKGAMLRVDAVGPLAFARFEGFDYVAGLLHRARHKVPCASAGPCCP